MADVFELMESCLSGGADLKALAEHPDWRVRYAAAEGIGETQDPAWAPVLKRMFLCEEGRPLYSQPPARFVNTTDDTRMAEEIGPIEVHFDGAPDAETLEAWRCRGRVKQAILYAVYSIGAADAEFRELIEECVARESEDYPVRAAAARALGGIGRPESRASLEAAASFDEWCTQTEARKALRRLADEQGA